MGAQPVVVRGAAEHPRGRHAARCSLPRIQRVLRPPRPSWTRRRLACRAGHRCDAVFSQSRLARMFAPVVLLHLARMPHVGHCVLCFTVDIKYKRDVSFVEYLSTASERLNWKACMLPSDELCSENAIIMSRFNRYPLVIDPSGQVGFGIFYVSGVGACA